MHRKDAKCRRIAIPQLNCLDAGEHCTSHALVFTARRYANAVFAMTFLSVCLSCLSQVGALSKWLHGSSWFWKLPSAYPTLCFKGIPVASKIGALPSRTLSQTLDLEFATAPSAVSSVVNLVRPTTIASLSLTLSVHLCLKHCERFCA